MAQQRTWKAFILFEDFATGKISFN